MLNNGSSATCKYELTSTADGMLKLPDAFFVPHRERTDDATLELSDQTHRPIRVIFGPVVGEALFEFLD